MNRNILGTMMTASGAAFVSATFVGVAAMAQSEAPDIAAITEAWLASPHADRMSEAFTHWDEEGEIPGTCAVCHSGEGITDYLSGPISTPGLIDHPVSLGTPVNCTACHSPGASELESVPFPSGVTIDTFGSSAVCAVCHQGRSSTNTVAAATDGLEDDTVSADLGFVNIHYAPSAATLMGGIAHGGFEYPGNVYKGRFDHVPNLNTCTSCHSPHSLEVEIETCTTCHQGIASFDEIRISPTDFDGDGNTAEGIANPIADFHRRLEEAIQKYAAEVTGVSIAYNSATYPYFFVDTDGDGTASETEAVFPNRYQDWTPRLLKAAYNYQLVVKEPAIFTHNPHYALQLLYDSLQNLSEKVEVDIAGLTRP